MKTSGFKKKKTLPVNQNQLAAYLGIKASTLSMANSPKYRRKLPSDASERLTWLQHAFELTEFQPEKPGISSVKINSLVDKALMNEYKKLLVEIKYFEQGAGGLAKRFDEMCSHFVQDIRWLHVIDNRLAASPTKKERTWLNHQQVITTERIEKNGRLAQFKMELNIEMARAKATVFRNIARKISSGLKTL